jgi:hypothetical protein
MQVVGANPTLRNFRGHMKKNFKNNIEEKPGRHIQSPWNYEAPHYDERSSCYVNAGSHYGVGHTQPVGSMTHSMKGAVPVGKNMGMTVDEVPAKNLTLDLSK